MKKIFAILTILTIAISVMPIIAYAAPEGPNECCKMRRALKIDDVPCAAGSIVQESDNSTCKYAIPADGPRCADVTTKWGLFCTMNTINTLVDYIFIFIVTVVMIFVMLGAFSILTAAGDPEKVTSGRNYIIYAAVGMAIAFLARAVPALVKAILGV